MNHTEQPNTEELREEALRAEVDEEFEKYALATVAHMNTRAKHYSAEQGLKFSLEESPAESATRRFAKIDLENYPESKEIVTLYVFFVGCGGGAINGATNALVADISETGKGAQLSLLGVFFGVGALGMPLVLGLLKLWLGFEKILTFVGILTLITGVSFLVIRYPSPKQPYGFPIKQSFNLFRDEILILVALFLFLQSSFEGITNNWTTLYLTDQFAVSGNDALLALSKVIFPAGHQPLINPVTVTLPGVLSGVFCGLTQRGGLASAVNGFHSNTGSRKPIESTFL